MSLSAGTRLGPYEIVASLGAGGMGEVYRARDTRLGRDVAIKVLPSDVAHDANRLARFEREARAVAALSHPNILALYDVGEANGIHYVVTELLEGETLREQLATGPLAQHSAVELGVKVARGLSGAHAKGIVHRDLKPANIFVSSDGVVKLLDFGLAKLVKPEAAVTPDGTTVDREPRTESGTVLGTMGYTSPEQLRGEAADARSDIFAFGCVLYEILSGRSPFLKPTGAETVAAIMSEDPPSLSGTGKPIASALTEIMKRCLEKRPDDRFSSAHDLALALQAYSGGPETPLTAPAVPVKRRWRRVAAASLSAVALFAALLAGWKLVSRPLGPKPEVTTKPPLRIVVLPFDNLGSPGDAYFASGMTEEITSRLANVRTLAVISRTTATQYDRKGKTVEQIGKDLGVGYVLEGSVRWDRGGGGPGRVRITPQLIRVFDDTHLWADRYDRQLADIFAIQGEVADGVVRALDLTLAPAESTVLNRVPTRDLAAYDIYLRALELENRRNEPSAIAQQIKLAGEAVERDPQFAEALALLAKARILNFWFYYDRRESELERARVEAERAVALRPDSAETHLALGFYHLQGRLDYERALAEFGRALALQPNEARAHAAIGYVRRRQWRMEEAEEELRKAVAGDPRNGTLCIELGITELLLRKYRDAIQNFEVSTSLNPKDAFGYTCQVGAHVLWRGDVAAAERVLHTAKGILDLEDPDGSVDYYLVRTALVARDWKKALRRIDESRHEVLSGEQQVQYLPRSLLRATVQSYIGRLDLARESYEEARRVLAEKISETPEDARLHSSLGIALAGLGRMAEATREGERGVDLMPLKRDALRGAYRLEDLGLIYTMVGNQEAAIQKLDVLLSRPSLVFVTLLRLDPRWDPLRKNPKFEALLAKYEVKP